MTTTLSNRLRLPVLTAALVAMGSVHAESEDSKARDLSFVAGIGFGVTQLKFTEKLDADPSFNAYQLFGSVGYDRWYASLNFADSVGDENVSEEDELGEASRRDIDLTFGYRITDHWTAFVGYKDGETELNLTVRDTDIVQNEYYREEGWFAGISRAFRLGRAGTINLSAAYIRFDTDLRFTEGFDGEEEDDDEEELEEPLEFDDLEGRSSGDSDGYSIGVSWVIPIAQKAAVRAQYKINNYDLEVRAQGQRFTPSQRLNYFDLTLLYAF